MIYYADILRSINALLGELYPAITRYGNETVDKAVPPYFFTEIVPLKSTRETKSLLQRKCSIKITYVQRVVNQADNLEKQEQIFRALGMQQRFLDREQNLYRSLLIRDFGFAYIGEHNNILQMEFSLDWREDMTETDREETIRKVEAVIQR